MKRESGTYALLLRASSAQSVTVGALGTLAVEPGWYIYVGSAFGPGGLRARVMRHVRADGACHWHVDYLRAVTTLTAVWYTHDDTRRECDWATVLRSGSTAQVPLAGFGASDCDCPSHLIRIDHEPSWTAGRKRLTAPFSNHAPVLRASPRHLREQG